MPAKNKKKSVIDQFLSLSDAEKDRIVAEFDREFVGETFGSLPDSKQRTWNRARAKRESAKRASPKAGRRANSVVVLLESALLQRADAYARSHGMTRSRLIAKGLRLAMSA